MRPRLTVLLVVLALSLALSHAVAADKPQPPAPPQPPGQPPPAPPSHPGVVPSREVPGGGQLPDASASRADVRLVAEGVGFERGGHTASVEPGRPLRARVVVDSPAFTEAVVRWRVDGEPVGETRAFLEPGRRTLLSPPLPTGKPGRYVLEASVEAGRGVATSYTVLGRSGPDSVPDQVVAVLDPAQGLAERLAAQLGLVLLRSDPLASTDGVVATYRVPTGTQVDEVLERLRGLPGVRSAD
ncbi:MAG: hypothetical protein ACK45F_10695, partial [bacterium]